jgi:uncharacterized membrane protein YdbT with pleckstrin-like domain
MSGALTTESLTLLSFLWVLEAIKFFALTFLVLKLILGWATTAHYLGPHQMIKYTGILQRDERIYELRSIRSVNRHQNWLGRLCNYGDLLMVIGASGYKDEIWIRGVVTPKKYERIFTTYLGAESRQFLTPQTPAGGGPDQGTVTVV